MVVDSAVMSEINQEENFKPSEEDLEHDYKHNLANGKKNLLCGDIPEAVACFEAACSTQSQRFGESNAECAEAYFYYGRGLFELARVENGVLGNALKGVPDTDNNSDSDSDSDQQVEETKNIPDHEREKLRLDVVEAMATTSEDGDDSERNEFDEKKDSKNGLSKVLRETTDRFISTGSFAKPKSSARTLFEKPANTEESKETEDVAKESTESTTNEPTTSNCEQPGTSSEPSTSSEVKPADEDPDDLPNMQLAWEMLELAKVLYAKKPKSDENSLMVAECNLKLGELGLEIENYEQAIGDYLESLKIHTELLEIHDRRLAETHYSLGLAYHMAHQYDNATEQYRQALKVLEARIDHLNSLIDEKNNEDTEVMESCTEVGNIKDLIPEINAKIEDVMAMKRERREMITSVLGGAGGSSVGFKSSASTSESPAPVCTVIPVRKNTAPSSSSSDQAVNDISHLIRRNKRSSDLVEGTVDDESNSSKKLKQASEDASSSPKNDVAEISNTSNSSVKDEANVPKSTAEKTKVQTDSVELKESSEKSAPMEN